MKRRFASEAIATSAAIMNRSWSSMEELDTSSQEDAALEKTTKPTAAISNQIDRSPENSGQDRTPMLAPSPTPTFPVLTSFSLKMVGDRVQAMTNLDSNGTSDRKSKTSKLQRSSAQPEDRLQRCRERNRIHARKTRLRKKEHMQSLQQRADELKQKQLRLKQVINEKCTASILVGFATSTTDEKCGDGATEDPRVEALLRRPTEDIPDSSKITELPALILPGQHASKKAKAESVALVKKVQEELPSEGFDLELLAKDRSKCTPEELDKIRRERNRMHAKRTRDRKRLFMEEMAEICRQLEEENDLLRDHLKDIDPGYHDDEEEVEDAPSSDATPTAPALCMTQTIEKKRKGISSPEVSWAKRKKVHQGNHLQYLLEAACTFDTDAKPDNSTSSALFAVVAAMNEASPKRRLQDSSFSATPAVGCFGA